MKEVNKNPYNSKDTNSRERSKAPLRETRGGGAHTAQVYENVLVHPHNVTNIIIEKNMPGETLANAPLRLVTAPNNVLSSFRNGPVKAGLNPAAKGPTVVAAASKPAELSKPRNPTPLSREPVPAKAAPAKKPRPSTAQHARPASPGIHGKIAEAPYKSSIKGYVVPKEIAAGGRVKNSTSPRQVIANARPGTATTAATTNSMSMRGVSPGKPRWKS